MLRNPKIKEGLMHLTGEGRRPEALGFSTEQLGKILMVCIS